MDVVSQLDVDTRDHRSIIRDQICHRGLQESEHVEHRDWGETG